MRTALLAVTTLALVQQPAGFEPPRAVAVERPLINPMTVGWGSTILTANVDESGAVTAVSSHGGDFDATGIVTQWRFKPASAEGKPVAAPVLVAGLVRPPELLSPLAPPDLAPHSRSLGEMLPAILETAAPPYPPTALGDAVVVVQLILTAEGEIKEASVAASTPGFDSAALETARRWRFGPAKREGLPVPATVLLLFGFRAPVIGQ